jgi:hypothetical protein
MLRKVGNDFARVMLDTHIFNIILDREMFNKLPKNVKYYTTIIQILEINAISDENLKEDILYIFHEVINEKVDLFHKKRLFFTQNNFGNSNFSPQDENSALNKMRNNNKKHIEDALIILTAKYNDCILVSEDKGTPFKSAKKLNYKILSWSEFLEKYS